MPHAVSRVWARGMDMFNVPSCPAQQKCRDDRADRRRSDRLNPRPHMGIHVRHCEADGQRAEARASTFHLISCPVARVCGACSACFCLRGQHQDTIADDSSVQGRRRTTTTYVHARAGPTAVAYEARPPPWTTPATLFSSTIHGRQWMTALLPGTVSAMRHIMPAQSLSCADCAHRCALALALEPQSRQTG